MAKESEDLDTLLALLEALASADAATHSSAGAQVRPHGMQRLLLPSGLLLSHGLAELAMQLPKPTLLPVKLPMKLILHILIQS